MKPALVRRSTPARTGRRARRGALFSMELIIVLPIAVGIFFAIAEFSMLWLANQKIKSASQVACRVGTLPATDSLAQDQAVRQAAERVLRDKKLLDNYQLEFIPGAFSGDEVVVRIKLPMDAAAPDMLAFLGFSLSDRKITAHTVMRRE